jgi:tetraacyldisaccharide 4'-kinase
MFALIVAYLNPAGWLEGLYLAVHRAVYFWRWRRRTVFPNRYIISVGNLSAGGTGKTPLTLFLANALFEAEIPALAVLRGYRGSLSRSGVLVSDGERRLVTAAEAGDEALLLAASRGLRVAAGRDRVDLIRRYGADSRVVLLDDAFQNPLVARDHELVLLDATVPVDRIRVFPIGRFRDPPAALSRAHTILLTRVDLASPENLRALTGLLARVAPGARVFRSRHAVYGLHPDIKQQELSRGLYQIGAFCGIGHPDAFFRSLKAGPLNFDVVTRQAFPDHHPYTVAELRDLFAGAARQGYPQLRFVTTAKDMVRIAELRDLPGELRRRIHALEMRLEILDGQTVPFVRQVLGPAL